MRQPLLQATDGQSKLITLLSGKYQSPNRLQLWDHRSNWGEGWTRQRSPATASCPGLQPGRFSISPWTGKLHNLTQQTVTPFDHSHRRGNNNNKKCIVRFKRSFLYFHLCPLISVLSLSLRLSHHPFGIYRRISSKAFSSPGWTPPQLGQPLLMWEIFQLLHHFGGSLLVTPSPLEVLRALQSLSMQEVVTWGKSKLCCTSVPQAWSQHSSWGHTDSFKKWHLNRSAFPHMHHFCMKRSTWKDGNPKVSPL